MTEKMRTASMMARKSRVDIEICYGGGAVVLDLATFVGAVVLGVEGPRGTEDTGPVGNGAVIAGAGTGCSSIGRSTSGWSLARSGGWR